MTSEQDFAQLSDVVCNACDTRHVCFKSKQARLFKLRDVVCNACLIHNMCASKTGRQDFAS